jgi:hypothetical protein
MGKNRTVQKSRVKILKIRIVGDDRVDYDEASDLENDKTLTRSINLPIKAQQNRILKNPKNFENFTVNFKRDEDDGKILIWRVIKDLIIQINLPRKIKSIQIFQKSLEITDFQKMKQRKAIMMKEI